MSVKKSSTNRLIAIYALIGALCVMFVVFLLFNHYESSKTNFDFIKEARARKDPAICDRIRGDIPEEAKPSDKTYAEGASPYRLYSGATESEAIAICKAEAGDRNINLFEDDAVPVITKDKNNLLQK